MSPLAYAACAVLIVCTTCCVDFAHARWSQAITEKTKNLNHRAGRWSVAQAMATGVVFVFAVKVSIYLLPMEWCGLYLGSIFAGRSRAVDSGKPG